MSFSEPFDPFKILREDNPVFDCIEEVCCDMNQSFEEFRMLNDLEIMLLMKTKSELVETLVSEELPVNISESIKNILNGNYIKNIEAGVPFHYQSMSSICDNEIKPVDTIQRMILNYVCIGKSNRDCEHRLLSCLLLGISFLEIFLQINYTGPELQDSTLSTILSEKFSDRRALQLLECDGTYTYGTL